MQMPWWNEWGGSYVDLDVLDGKNPDGRLQVRSEPVELSSSAEPLDGIQPVAHLQLVSTMQDDVCSPGDGQSGSFQGPHHQSAHSFDFFFSETLI